MKSIDLRNNQLNHLCAQSISDMIVRNSTLQKLDLRWNSVGLTGGRSIVKALTRNPNILSLHVSGNNIPSELMESIEIATSSSALRYMNNTEQNARSKFLTNKLQEKEEERNIQVKSLMEQLEKVEKSNSENERWNCKKLAQMEDALSEKDKIIETFALKIQELESENWSLSEEKNGLALSISALEFKNKQLVEEHESILTKYKKEREKAERELVENLGSLKEENLFLKEQIQDLQNRKAHLEKELTKLKSKLEELSVNAKATLEEQVLSLNKKHDEAVKEAADFHQNEISRIRTEFAETEKILKMKISLLESRKIDFEEEVKEKSGKLLSERAQYEERLINIEKKLKSDHEGIRQQLEERIDLLEDANKEQNDHLQSNLQALYQLRTDVTAMDLELAEQTHEIQHLKKCLEEKDAEMKARETKIKLEVKEQLEELEKANSTIHTLSVLTDSLKQSIADSEQKHTDELNAKEEKILNLEAEIKKYEKRIEEMSEDELQRTSQLQKAFEIYFKSKRHDASNSVQDSPKS